MPVLPPTPASFGAALAAHALLILRGGGGGGGSGGGGGGSGGVPCPPPRPVPALTLPYQKKLHQRFVQYEEKQRKLQQSTGAQPNAPQPHEPQPNEPRLSIDDVGLLVCDVFRC